MAPRRELIVVSNRGPVSFGRADGGRVARRSSGGLVTALRGLLEQHDVTWIASAVSEEDRAVAAEAGGAAFGESARDGSPYRLRLVAHEPAAYDRYYNVIANPLLWFVQHYLWDLARQPVLDEELHAAWTDGYERVNQGFAAAVIDELDATPGATVFFHDYHLYLAPAFVRAVRPDAVLAQFIHVPWPQSDYWHVLPEPLRRAVHEGLLANDVVGFHTSRWRRNFIRTCSDLLDADVTEASVEHAGRRTFVSSHPISIDPSEFDELAESPAVLAAEAELVAARPDRLVLRVERTDPSKNIVRGFRAFGLLLERHPEHMQRVGMLALLDPSRQDIPEYSEYLDAIRREAEAVNARFAAAGWVPIDLRVRDNFPEAVAAYKQFDVLLVNAVFDGMNLVAKEAPLVNRRDGVLVLSENAGVHEELGAWALTVDPFDIVGQADALHQALRMPAGERRSRADAIRAHVRAHDIAGWTGAQLADVDRLARNLSA